MSDRIPEDVLQSAVETRFSCARCGHCCKGDGLVHIGPAEAERAAAHLGLTRRQFLRRFAIRIEAERWILRDKLERAPGRPGPLANAVGLEKWCIFLEIMPDGLYGCLINEAKPNQCATFPAQWRNPDSLQTCLGLRLLRQKLRAERNTAADSGVAGR